MLLEPSQGLLGHLFKRARLFKEVGGTGNDGELLRTAEQPVGSLIHLDDGLVVAANKEQGWCGHLWQIGFCEVRPPATGDDGTDRERGSCSRLQRGTGSCGTAGGTSRPGG